MTDGTKGSEAIEIILGVMSGLKHPDDWRVMLSIVVACLDEKKTLKEFDEKVESFAEGLRLLKRIGDHAHSKEQS